MMKSTRSRRAAALAAAFVLLLAFGVLAPGLLRGPLEARVRAAIDDRVDAEVRWGGVGVSLLRDFPRLGIRVDGVTVTGVGDFAGEPLADVARLRVVVDLGSALRAARRGEPLVVRELLIDRPAVRLLVLEDGRSNWDIVRPSPDAITAPAPAVTVSLRALTVRDASLRFDDLASDLSLAVEGYGQTLAGDFGRERFTLRTTAGADAITFRSAGVPMLSRTAVALRADVDADLVEGRFTLRDNELLLNDLALSFAGSAARAGEQVELDLTFAAPRTDVRQLLSLVPAIYANDFAALRASGTMAVEGSVRGRAGGEDFPALSIRATVEDGGFQYPDLPLAARDIALDLAIDNPGGSADATVLALRRFHARIGNDPIAGSLTLRTPLSDPDVDVRLDGTLDLADLGRTVRMEGVEELAGRVVANLTARARQSDLAAERFDRVAASGHAALTGVRVRGPGMPHDLAVDEARLEFTPAYAELHHLAARIGASDLSATGRLENPIGFALRDEPLRGRIMLEGSHFDLNEWQSDREEVVAVAVPADLHLDIQTAYERVTLGLLEMTAVRGGVTVRDERATLDGLSLRLLGGEVAISGFYDTRQPAHPAFDGRVRIAGMDIPTAYTGLSIVRAFAPVARYAEGTFSADLALRGTLGSDLVPVFAALNGEGALETSRLVLHEFPAMTMLANLVRLEQLREPVLTGVRSVVEIRDGRLHVRPFDVGLEETRLAVSGSSGIDQSLDYDLRLQLPRSALGPDAAPSTPPTRAPSSSASGSPAP